MKTKKIILIIIFVIMFIYLGLTIYKMSKQDEDNFNKCIENYSVNYCKKSIYGIY